MPNIKLELVKILKSKKLLILLLLCLLIPSAIMYRNYSYRDRYGRDLITRINTVGTGMYVARMQYKDRMEEVELSPGEVEFHMAPFNRMLEELESLNSAMNYQHRYEIPERMVAFYQAYQDYAEHRAVYANGRQFFYIHLGDDAERVELEKAYFQDFLDRGLPYEDPVYSTFGSNFVKSVIDTAFGLPLALLLILLLTDVFSEEKNNGTEKVRLIQPVKRRNILLAKLAVLLVYILVLIMLTVLVSYTLAGIFGGGFGSIYYPIEVDRGYITSGGPIGEYIALALLLFFLYLVFIFSGLALLATIFKETSIVVALGILMVIIGDKWGGSPSHFNPFSFLNYEYFLIWTKAFGPNVVGFPDNPQANLWIATGITLAISTLVLSLTYFLSKTTWIQNFSLAAKAKDGEKALQQYTGRKTLPLPVFRFEVVKIIKKGTVIIPFLMLLVFVTLYGIDVHNQYGEYRDLEEARLNIVITHNEVWVTRLQQRAGVSSQPELYEEALAHAVDILDMYRNAAEAFNSGDTASIIRAQKKVFIYEVSLADFYPSESTTVYSAALDAMLERGVQPIYSESTNGGLIYSPFAKESDVKFIREFQKRNSQPSTTYIFNSLFKDGLSILILAIFAISLALGFSDETQDTRTLSLLNTQPLKRRKIFFSKLLAQFAVFLCLILILITVFFSSLQLSGSPLEKNFPAVKYLNNVDEDYSGVKLWRSGLREHEGKSLPKSASGVFVGFTFRDMIYENLEMVFMLILSGFAIISFAMLISQKIRHKIGVSLGTALFFAVGYIASRYVLKGVGILFPFIWLNQPLVATGEASIIFDVTIMNSYIGYVILVLWLAAFVYLGYRMFIKTGRYQ